MAGLICIGPLRGRCIRPRPRGSAGVRHALVIRRSVGCKEYRPRSGADWIHSRSIDCRYVPLDKELVARSARICGPVAAQRSKRRADGQRAMVIRRIDELTATKVSIVISARAAFGEDFGYRTAWSIGLPAGLITSVFARPFRDTLEFGLAFSAPGDRRRTPR